MASTAVAAITMDIAPPGGLRAYVRQVDITQINVQEI